VAKADTQADATAKRPAAPEAAKNNPVAAKPPNTPVAARPQPGAASPRQVCAGRERYALLQCMQEQCAKRAWSGHEQCVRLRRDRKL
jgi:hypothetical protein